MYFQEPERVLEYGEFDWIFPGARDMFLDSGFHANYLSKRRGFYYTNRLLEFHATFRLDEQEITPEVEHEYIMFIRGSYKRYSIRTRAFQSVFRYYEEVHLSL